MPYTLNLFCILSTRWSNLLQICVLMLIMLMIPCFTILMWSTTRSFWKCGLNYCDICGNVFVWNINNISFLWDRNWRQCYCHTIDKSPPPETSHEKRGGTKTDEFSGKFQTAFDPHRLPFRMVPFSGNHVHIFHTIWPSYLHICNHTWCRQFLKALYPI